MDLTRELWDNILCVLVADNSDITPWIRVVREKLERTKLPKKFPAFYGT